jgi:hypothetical protein
LAASKAAAHFYTFSIPLSQLQHKVSRQFPIEKTNYWLTVRLLDPVVRLDEEANRIGVELTIRLHTLGDLTFQWRGLVDGRLEYHRETSGFYLLNPNLRRLHLDGAPSHYQSITRTVTGLLLDKVFATTPIYQLDTTKFRHSLAKLLLKSMTIKKDKILIELGL